MKTNNYVGYSLNAVGSSPDKQEGRSSFAAPFESLEHKLNAGNFSDPTIKKYSLVELTALERPVDVDPKRKESYLGDVEFGEVFGMAIEAFKKMPAWRQQTKKKEKGLF